MTMMSTYARGEVRTTERARPSQTRTLWTDHDTGITDPPEQAFAEIFGDADRVRIALWIDRAAPAHGGLFCADTCASELGLPEASVRVALGPLQHLEMVQYRGGLYMRQEHQLWAVLKVLRTFAGPSMAGAADTPPPTEAAIAHQDARAATFYFG
jgi:hypothetical protein